MGNWEMVELTYDDCIADTGEGGAKLFVFDEDRMWIPNSLIESDDGSVVEVPRWFAEKENLI